MLQPMLRCVALLLGLLWTASAVAQPLDVDALARQPGTTVTHRTENGVAVTELSRAGVVIEIRPDGELTLDKTGKAVWCFWEIAVDTKITADRCYPGQFPQVSQMLGDYVDAANAFIVANNPRPVTRAQLEQRIAQDRDRKACAGGPESHPLLQVINADLEKFRSDFMASLKVPRWPAANPCL